MKLAPFSRRTKVALCCGVAVLFTAAALAQAPGTPQGASPVVAGYQAFTLRHTRASDVKRQLEQMLAGGREPFEVVVDASTNRLLVGGSPATQALAAQTLATLDQPPPTAPPAAVEVPRVATYSVPGLSAEALAAELQQRYAGLGARVAADARTGQVLVAAGESIQQNIAGYVAARPLAAPPIGTPAAAPIVPSTPPSAPQPGAQPAAYGVPSVVLQRADWPQLETKLRALYGARLSTTTTEGDGRIRFQLTPAGAAPLEFVYDPSRRQIDFHGDPKTAEAAVRLITALDRSTPDRPQHVVPYRSADQESIRHAMTVSHRLAAANDAAAPPLDAVPQQGPALPKSVPLMARVFQPAAAQAQPAPVGAVAPPVPAVGANPPAANQAAPLQVPVFPPAAGAADGPVAGLVGPVQIEFLEGLDVLVVSGNDRDVERVIKIIEDIEKLSIDTQPVIEIVTLQHVSGDALASVVMQIYNAVLSSRQGAVSITSLVKPNALLLIGRAESVQAVKELIAKLDQPVEPSSQFAVFPLKHASAATVQTTLQNFFADRTGQAQGGQAAAALQATGLGPRVQVTADVRSNSLIVRAGPRDLAEAGELIKRLDVSSGEAENELRVFHLENALADELAPVLQEAVTAQLGGSGAQQQQQQQANPLQGIINPGAAGTQAGGASTSGTQTPRSAALRFTTIDSQGHRQYRSGILTEVRITADARANSLVVSAPAEAMDLIAALVRQLDETPAARAQIKVFTIVNGDASALVEMLNALFGRTSTSGTTGGFGGVATQQQQQTQNLLVPLRFSVDQRTNSIIASGGAEDLTVVEAILLRLDDSDVRQRESTVYRLKNAPAADVANAINQYLRSEREVQQVNPGLLSPFEQIEREVVVVPEPVSNSLIVSSTPRYFDMIRKLVEDIDKRPPMVMIQVLIAEVALNNADEFGIELGLQDSVLFDRSLLGDLVTITQSTQQPQGNTVVTTTNQNVVAATNQPGYAFNNAPLGNSGATSALANAGRIGAQGLSNFAVGRTNADLGFGGLVLSASSESVSMLIRALQESRRLDVLSRPQVMTLDNQAAFVQVGSRVPRVQGVTINTTGQVNNVVDVNVGLILGVTPRISPDGLVVMEIDAEKSALGPEIEGVPISVSATGEVVRQPLINTTTAQTTVSAMNGQTVVLGGLITKTHSVVHRRVPMLSSVPVLGNLFRYDFEQSERTELLIIMTPHIVREESDATRLRQIESARMSWCLADVKALTGNSQFFGRSDIWSEDDTMVIYPDVSPTGEPVPPPASQLPAPPAEGGASPSAIPPVPPAVTPVPPPPVLPPANVPQSGELPDAGEPQSSTLRISDDQAYLPQVFAPPPPDNAPAVMSAQYHAPLEQSGAAQGVVRP